MFKDKLLAFLFLVSASSALADEPPAHVNVRATDAEVDEFLASIISDSPSGPKNTEAHPSGLVFDYWKASTADLDAWTDVDLKFQKKSEPAASEGSIEFDLYLKLDRETFTIRHSLAVDPVLRNGIRSKFQPGRAILTIEGANGTGVRVVIPGVSPASEERGLLLCMVDFNWPSGDRSSTDTQQMLQPSFSIVAAKYGGTASGEGSFTAGRIAGSADLNIATSEGINNIDKHSDHSFALNPNVSVTLPKEVQSAPVAISGPGALGGGFYSRLEMHGPTGYRRISELYESLTVRKVDVELAKLEALGLTYPIAGGQIVYPNSCYIALREHKRIDNYDKVAFPAE